MFFFQFIGKFFEGFECFLRKIVFNPAGIILGCCGIDADGSEQIGQDQMSFMDHPGNAFCLVGKGDMSIFVYFDIAILLKPLELFRDSRLGEAQMTDNIDGPAIAILKGYDSDGFKVHFN